jgi:hypothetical protein
MWLITSLFAIIGCILMYYRIDTYTYEEFLIGNFNSINTIDCKYDQHCWFAPGGV